MAVKRLFQTSLAGIALALACAHAQAPGDVRVALVIGNGAYAGADALANPANDARAMSATLRALGFTVIDLRDASRAQMLAAIVRTKDALQGNQGIGMLYYAGHGVQLDARNYMVPIDARMARVEDVATQNLDIGSVIEAFRTAGTRMNIVVLDACRNNPFGNVASGKGLAPLDAPSGTFLAYATAPGNVAEDGDATSGNGLYTQFLLKELKAPQASIENVFKRVRYAVRQASNGRQIPWESTSLEDDFQFNTGKLQALAKAPVEQLLASYTEQKRDWDRIKDSTRAEDFYAFLQKYPSGALSEAAQGRLNLLSQTPLVVQGAGSDGSALPYTVAKYRLGDVFEQHMEPGNVNIVQRVIRVSKDEVAVEMRTGTLPKTVSLYDSQGGMLGVEGMMRLNPPSYLIPPGLLQLGRRWPIAQLTEHSGATFNLLGNQFNSGEGLIAARERVTVPAGSFDTFRIETSTASTTKVGTVNMFCKHWIDPALPIPVKGECTGGPMPIATHLTRVALANKQ